MGFVIRKWFGVEADFVIQMLWFFLGLNMDLMNPRQKGSYGRSSFEKDSAYAMGIYMGYTYHI